VIVGRLSPLNETNLVELYGNTTVENHGGIVFRAPDPNDASSSLVLVIGVKTIEAAETSFEVETNATSAGRQDIYRKLDRIHLGAVTFQNLPLNEVIRILHKQSQLRDPDKAGINFLFNPNMGAGEPIATIDPATGLPLKAKPASPATNAVNQINIDLGVSDVSLKNLLDAICLVADHPLKYSVEDYGIVFSPKDPATEHYEMRTFKIDADRLLGRHLRKPTPGKGDYPPDLKPGEGYIWATTPGKSEVDIQVKNEVLKLTSKLGVNLDPPKTIFYNESLQVLFVYATLKDLDAVERALAEMNVGTVNPSDPGQQAAVLAKDGQLLYEMGRLDEAQLKLEEALSLDPDNQEARYYLNLTVQAQQPRQESGDPNQAPFLLGKPRVYNQVPLVLMRPSYNPGAFPDNAFDPHAIRSSFQPVSAPVDPADLQTNYFQINVAAFNAAVLKETGDSDSIEGFKELALKAGVDLSPPKQALIASERFGRLYVIETRNDMRIIGNILHDLHCLGPQIHIKARFFEVPKTFFDDERDSIPSSVTNGGILTHAQFRKFLHQLQSQKDSEELAEPEVTTIAGRQTQMRATILQDVVTNYLFQPESATQRVSSISPQMTKVETGPILDVMPSVWPDGYTIDLTAIPALVKFYGYADTRGLSPSYGTNSDGEKIPLPIALPVFGVGEVKEQTALYDGQTLVLLPGPQIEYNGGMEEKYRDRIVKHIQEAQKKEGDKTLIVLVTVTLIDPVGNRLHTEKEMPFAQTGLPPQWP
jgi:tetratricopeptide (TPR) repeat protein